MTIRIDIEVPCCEKCGSDIIHFVTIELWHLANSVQQDNNTATHCQCIQFADTWLPLKSFIHFLYEQLDRAHPGFQIGLSQIIGGR